MLQSTKTSEFGDPEQYLLLRSQIKTSKVNTCLSRWFLNMYV